MFLVLSATSVDDCLDFWGKLRFCLDLKFSGPGFECSGGPT